MTPCQKPVKHDQKIVKVATETIFGTRNTNMKFILSSDDVFINYSCTANTLSQKPSWIWFVDGNACFHLKWSWLNENFEYETKFLQKKIFFREIATQLKSVAIDLAKKIIEYLISKHPFIYSIIHSSEYLTQGLTRLNFDTELHWFAVEFC